MSSKAAIKKLPPLPCKTNRNPLTSGESRSITHDVKYFDTHDVNIPSDFPYHLPQANRPSYYTISYFQFQSPQSAKAFPNVGSPGDVWLKTAPGSQIFYKASKWIEWESGTSVLESATDRVREDEAQGFGSHLLGLCSKTRESTLYCPGFICGFRVESLTGESEIPLRGIVFIPKAEPSIPLP